MGSILLVAKLVGCCRLQTPKLFRATWAKMPSGREYVGVTPRSFIMKAHNGFAIERMSPSAEGRGRHGPGTSPFICPTTQPGRPALTVFAIPRRMNRDKLSLAVAVAPSSAAWG